jgi:hypothetical protein
MAGKYSEQHVELLKQSREAAKEDRENAALFEVLVASQGWKAYVAMLERSMQARADKILQPSKSIDGCIDLEYEKGALSGLVIARDLPSVTIAAAKELRPTEDEE